MYLSDIKIEGYRLFKDRQILHLRKGLNVLVGENGCGKSTVIDAIRLLLNEDEYARSGISEEDFYSSVDKKEWLILFLSREGFQIYQKKRGLSILPGLIKSIMLS